MRKTLLLLLAAVAIPHLSASAASGIGLTRTGDAMTARELYVPYEDLNVILEGQPRRVLLSREEYAQLKKAAIAEAEARPGHNAAILAADYRVEVQAGRAAITGELSIEVLVPGIHALALDLAGVGLRKAELDGGNAAIGRSDDGHLDLFVSGKGLHGLRLELVAPLETTAATQVLNYRLPTPAATRVRLTVPGDVEVKAGAETISREVEQDGSATRFELVPRRGDVSLVMTLNSKLLRQERVVVARSVIVAEVTQVYERLHATFSMTALHKAVDAFEFRLPAGFEVTYVQSPQMARWSVDSSGGDRILRIHLREQTAGLVVLSLSAIRAAPKLDAWSMPRLTPLDVEGQVSVVGLVLEDRLQPRSLKTDGLIPVDTLVLTRALPASVFQAEPGSPRVRPIIAGYAPQRDFSILAEFHKPEAEMFVTTNLLLTLTDKGHEMRGGFAILPKEEKRFGLDFAVPEGWDVTTVTDAENKTLPIERFDSPKGGTRVHVRLPQGVAPLQEYQIYFQASHQPAGWLAPWTTRETAFPIFGVLGASRESGALAVAVKDDIAVRPSETERIEPLDEHEKEKYGLGGVPTQLAFRFEGADYRMTLAVERVKPRLTARSISSFVVTPDFLIAHYEVFYEIQEAATRELALLLPKSMPESLVIRGLGPARLKEYSSQLDGDYRRWQILLAEPGRGSVRLAVDCRQPLTDEGSSTLSLPVVKAEGVSYQSGLISVEGSAELNVEVKTDLGKADVGELVDAEYQPGKRLLGVYRFVGDQPAITVNVSRDAAYALPAVIVERAELATLLDAGGLAQTAARYALRTKAPFVQLELPSGSKLWSVEVDGLPAAPQREGESLMISLPAKAGGTLRDLRVVYETQIEGVALFGNLEVSAPRLRLRGEEGATAIDVPAADLLWRLYTPSGYEVLSTAGTVVTEQVTPSRLALSNVAKWLFKTCGGVNWFYGSCGLARARAMAKVGMRLKRGELNAVSQEEDKRPVGGAAMQPRDAAIEPRQPAPPPPPPAVQTAGSPGQPRPSVALAPQAASTTKPPLKPQQAGIGWALSGVRSLRIELQRGGKEIVFHSLGEEPKLVVGVAHTRRSSSLAWALAGLVILVGLARVNWSVKSRATMVVAIIGVATILPLIAGSAALAQVLNPACYAGFALIPLYVAISVVRRLAVRFRPNSAVSNLVATAAATLLVMLVLCPAAHAETSNDHMIRSLVERLHPPAPAGVPADAVIVPYDPKTGTGIRDAAQLLVPYDQFVELWNQAHPDRQIEAIKPPKSYGLAGATYMATLQGDEYLLVEGVMEIEVYTDEMVSIPLGLEGGVLAGATLDGRTARLSIATVSADQPSQAVQVPAKGKRPPRGSVFLLHVTGKGRHRLELSVRMRLDRPGGWRVAQGQLPAAPATALSLVIPQAQTELRIGQVADRRTLVTSGPGEVLNTALNADGKFDVSWRPKVGEAAIDRSLTVESSARFDVQEDGLMLDWTLRLSFRRGEREFFRFGLPTDYIVLQVTGSNVRGWETRDVDGRREIEVTLLKPAKDRDEIAVHLWHRGKVGDESFSTFELPMVSVPDAILHQGSVAIRRSPLLNLRTIEVSGVARTDLTDTSASRPADNTSPLGIRPYQAYRFAATPFVIRLEATPVSARVTARFQTILRVAERERMLESRVILKVEDRPLYQVRIALPADLKVDRVTAPGVFEWAIAQQAGGPLLNIYLAGGQRGDVPITLTGTLGKPGPVEQVPLPRLAVQDVAEQEGDIVVQGDPAYRIEAEDLVDCESVLLTRVFGWLTDAQRAPAQLAVHYRGDKYKGSVRVTQRQPDVSCHTVSSVRVTSRAIEETVLLDFNVRDAGIRELSFLLPAQMKDARISVPQLRLKTIQPTSDGTGAPIRVRLELQDRLMGQVRVLIENDRLLTAAVQSVPIPVVETGRTVRRYVVLESAGRSEVVIESSPGLDALTREQQEWRWLSSVLGGKVTQAYLVQPEAQQPALKFRTQERAVVETAGASIGLAETLMVVDAQGTYRAGQILRVNNATEQYLEILMPDGAVLWTARVAGEPVKPTQVPDRTKARHVRIPLIKTATGDLDYEVVLKYGGRLGPIGITGSVTFPVIETVNIEVALSQVRLYLPETHRWFRFGGTMRQAGDEVELAADYVTYQTRKARQLAEALSSADDYAKVRAAENVRVLGGQMQEFQSFNSAIVQEGRLRKELLSNAMVISQAGEQVKELAKVLEQGAVTDNRGDLNDYFAGQANTRSSNVVMELGTNFETGDASAATLQPGGDDGFSHDWFVANGLVSPAPQSIIWDAPATAPAEVQDLAGIQGVANLYFSVRQEGAKARQPAVPQVIQEAQMEDLRQSLDRVQVSARERKKEDVLDGKGDTLTRYQDVVRERASVSQRRSSMSYGHGVELGHRSTITLDAMDDADGDDAKDRSRYRGTMGGMGMGGMGGGMEGMGAGYGAYAGGGDVMTGGAGAGVLTARVPGGFSAKGLASLDVDIPVRGQVYFFTTPQGKAEITARAVSRGFLSNLRYLVVVLVLAGAALACYRALAQKAFTCCTSRRGAVVTIVLGLIAVIVGFLPVVGLLAVAVGLIVLIRARGKVAAGPLQAT